MFDRMSKCRMHGNAARMQHSTFRYMRMKKNLCRNRGLVERKVISEPVIDESDANQCFFVA